MSWGPSHQRAGRRWWERRWVGRRWWWLWIAWVIASLTLYDSHRTIASAIFDIGMLVIIVRLCLWARTFHDRGRGYRLSLRAQTLQRIRRQPTGPAAAVAAGVHLGTGRDGHTRRSAPEHAVLVLGPPRSGKTSGVIIPTLLSHRGAVVSTSTKPDVMRATHTTRGQSGQVWQFDPTATSPPPDGVQALRWSPVLASTDWDGALLMARAMVTGAHVGTGTTEASHWTRRAQALLAPLLHAAAVSGKGIADVVDWINRHEVDEPGALLAEHDGSRLAVGQLVGLGKTEARERSSIFSAAADAIDAYSSQAALDAATDPNFFAGRFVTSQDTIYIHAPAENQQLAAPLVCGLLAEIRRATYQRHRDATLRRPVLFALDEVANVAPITELPQLASEGASQGVLLLAALQDLSQARARWGTHADGFMTLFGTKLLLPGIADQKTLEAVSTMLGEYDRRVVSHNHPNTNPLAAMVGGRRYQRPHSTTSYSTQRQRVLTPGQVAAIPAGKALHLRGVSWELVLMTPAHTTEPWRSLTHTTPAPQ